MKNRIIYYEKEHTILEKIVCIIDCLINPNEPTYPIATFDIPPTKFEFLLFKENTGYLFTIKKTGKKLLYFRYIKNEK